MMFLAAGPVLPHHGVAGSGDWAVAILSIAAFAIATAIMLVIGNRATASEPTTRQKPADTRRKAA
jgi:hypothetical protein